ncbi:hypothetical protein NJC40_13200 [Pseudomonas sp. 21LCFQ02]|uniref:hypothetical protein n=1 Tax=unclassified Pseudomonas TaxID=196821 RepID=UPI0004F58C31|nr:MULTISPECIES: hypothetical protein [unclassified Pseudomonas]MCO8161891.1 hypothetical protein [Pseudomonas sp. 21LCFQ010]MCO8168723.1 hypothetical protein [Pseudomonas sp. 21LCFQ02]MCQ9423107.1 hypothetical protein [Pseudomonas sp. LJDD11]BAP45044.1 putative orphan protein [Pseudomonas sp. StFLB209]
MMQKPTEKPLARLAQFYKYTSHAEREAFYAEVQRRAAAEQQQIIDKANAIRAAHNTNSPV